MSALSKERVDAVLAHANADALLSACPDVLERECAERAETILALIAERDRLLAVAEAASVWFEGGECKRRCAHECSCCDLSNALDAWRSQS